jgi:hypothetical protein
MMNIPVHSDASERNPDGEEHRGPHLLGLAIVTTALFFASLLVTALLTHGGHLPSPFDPATSTAGFFSDYRSAVQINAFLQLGAAIVLGNFAVSVVSRLRFLGVRVSGVYIALFGGILAASLSLLSSLVQWVLAQPDVTSDPAMIHAWHLFFFAVGGVGHVAAAGLLMAGVSLSGGLSGFVPRWLMWLGLVLAGISEIATLTMVAPAFALLLPIARFGAFVWMIGVGATLPKSRAAAKRKPPVRRTPPVFAHAPLS